MGSKKKVVLAVPRIGMRQKKWRSFLLGDINSDDVSKFVFHSKHIKIWPKRDLKIQKTINRYSRSIVVDDKTEHFDEWLLNNAFKIFYRSKSNNYRFEKAVSITLHYLYNMKGLTYSDEIKYLNNRVKAIRKFLGSGYTAKDDHGWELEALRKQGLI